MLAQPIVQILTDAALFTGADVQNCLLQLFALGDIDAGGNDVGLAFRCFREASCWTMRSVAAISVPGHPVALVFLGQQVRAQCSKYQP